MYFLKNFCSKLHWTQSGEYFALISNFRIMEVSRFRSKSLLLSLLHQTNTHSVHQPNYHRASNLLLEKHTFVQPKTKPSNANFRPPSRDKWTDNPQKSFTKQVLNKLDSEFKTDNTLQIQLNILSSSETSYKMNIKKIQSKLYM